jgi:iron(III) transport system substrate-binding protein
VLLIFFALAASIGACADAGAPQGEVVLYTSMPNAVVDRLEGVIEQRFPDLEGEFWLAPLDTEGIALRVVRGRTADIQELLADEMDRGEIKADLIWLAEPSPYETYKDLGLLAPYEPPADAPIPAGYIDPDGFYVAGRVISMVVAWNTSLLSEGLTDWPDLHDVEMAAFPAPESGASRATIKALIDKYGSEFFTTLADRGMVSVASNGAARDGVAEGSFEAVAVLDYMARGAKAAGSPIDFAYPAGGTVLIPSPIAITASAENPAAAKAVVDFILSQSGQQIIVKIGDFYPVRIDVAPPAGAPPLHTITALDVDWSALTEEIDSISAMWMDFYGTPQQSG